MKTNDLIKALKPHKKNYNPSNKVTSIVAIEHNREKNELYLTSSMKYDIETIVIIEGVKLKKDNVFIESKIYVDMKLLEKVLRLCGSDVSMKFVKIENHLYLFSNDIEYMIFSEPPVVTPAYAHENVDMIFSIPHKFFVQTAKKVRKFVSKSPDRATIRNISVRQYQNYLRFSATDGRTICDTNYYEVQQQFELTDELKKEGIDYLEALIPGDVIDMVYEHKLNGHLLFVGTKSKNILTTPFLTVAWSVHETKYPMFEKAMQFQEEPRLEIIVNKKMLMNVLKTAIAFSKTDSLKHFMKMKIDVDYGDTITEATVTGYYTSDKDKSLFNASIPFLIHWMPENTSLTEFYCFNCLYLYEIVKEIETEEIKIVLRNPRDPMMIYPMSQFNSVSLQFLLMPLRNSENR